MLRLIEKTFLINQLQVIWEHMIALEKLQGDDFATGYLLDYSYFKDYLGW